MPQTIRYRSFPEAAEPRVKFVHLTTNVEAAFVTAQEINPGIYDSAAVTLADGVYVIVAYDGDKAKWTDTITIRGNSGTQFANELSIENTISSVFQNILVDTLDDRNYEQAIANCLQSVDYVAPANSTIASIYALVQFIDSDVATMADDVVAALDDWIGVGNGVFDTYFWEKNAVITRDEILNRVLAGNHNTNGTVGKLLQYLDAAITSRLSATSDTVTKVAEIDDILTALTEVVATVTRFKQSALTEIPNGSGGVNGSGADMVTLTIRDEGGDPVPDMDVWISSDAGGSVIVAGTKQTSDLGQVQFLLTHGASYYLWAQKSGVNGITGLLFTAERD